VRLESRRPDVVVLYFDPATDDVRRVPDAIDLR
jgi:hypothetical protein